MKLILALLFCSLTLATGQEIAGPVIMIPAGLKLYYKLDETSGTTATDSSGNGFSGTGAGTPTWTTGKIHNGVNLVAGSSQQLSNGSVNASFGGSTTATLAAWINKSSTSNNAIVGFGNADNSTVFNRCNIKWQSDSNVYFQIESGASSFPFAALAGTGWHHIAMVFDGSQTGIARITAYIDGVATSLTVSGGANPPAALASTANLATFYVGRELVSPATPVYSTAVMDEVRLYNRALSAQEISYLYHFNE